jgi:hypothetical protein
VIREIVRGLLGGNYKISEAIAGVFTVFGIDVSAWRPIIVLTTVAIVAGTWLFLARTSVGLQVRGLLERCVALLAAKRPKRLPAEAPVKARKQRVMSHRLFPAHDEPRVFSAVRGGRRASRILSRPQPRRRSLERPPPGMWRRLRQGVAQGLDLRSQVHDVSLCRSRYGSLHFSVPPGFRRLELGSCKPGAQFVGLRLQRPAIGSFAFEQQLHRAQGTNDVFAIRGRQTKALTVLRRGGRRQQIEAAGRRGAPPDVPDGSLAIA